MLNCTFVISEAQSASGLRALRYAREVEGTGQVVAPGNDKASVEACRRNIKFNGSVATAKVESKLADARVYMLTHPKEFEMSIADEGMLMCTATDMAVLCGCNGEVCYSKYGSYPLKAKYCHEMALQVLLECIEIHANRYKRYIVPVLSVQMDFYIRVFVRIYTVRYLPGFGPVVPQECSDCGKKYNMGGPIWSAPIHDQDWVTSILSDMKSMKARYPAFDRISAVLTTISEELPDVPLFVSLQSLCATLKCTSPSSVVFRSAVINAGYRISGTHVNLLGLSMDVLNECSEADRRASCKVVTTRCALKRLEDKTVHSLNGFLVDRLADWRALRGALVSCLALMRRKTEIGAISSSDANAVARSFMQNLQVQYLGQSDRNLCFEILECLTNSYPDIVMSMDEFVYVICEARDGEKDPQCLLLTFRLVERLAQCIIFKKVKPHFRS
ncbi:putative tRNA (guanine(26)-N(2))-dimethyltransferase [Helianthus debilis subsp. tardiflorus]